MSVLQSASTVCVSRRATDEPAARQCGAGAANPGARAGDFDGQTGPSTEMDALVAYLQVLGTMVDFSASETPAPAGEKR